MHLKIIAVSDRASFVFVNNPIDEDRRGWEFRTESPSSPLDKPSIVMTPVSSKAVRKFEKFVKKWGSDRACVVYSRGLRLLFMGFGLRLSDFKVVLYD